VEFSPEYMKSLIAEAEAGGNFIEAINSSHDVRFSVVIDKIRYLSDVIFVIFIDIYLHWFCLDSED
jgi:hypothetical protein